MLRGGRLPGVWLQHAMVWGVKVETQGAERMRAALCVVVALIYLLLALAALMFDLGRISLESFHSLLSWSPILALLAAAVSHRYGYAMRMKRGAASWIKCTVLISLFIVFIGVMMKIFDRNLVFSVFIAIVGCGGFVIFVRRALPDVRPR